MELISKLGIDGKILLAQIVNFAILLFVLFKFVYRPVLDLLEKRSKKIEKGIHDAEEAGNRLLQADKMKDEKIGQAEREVGRLIEDARKDAETMKKELLAAAQAQSEDLLKRARLQMNEEKDKMMSDIKKEVTMIVVQATGRLLQREFSQTDQKRLLDAISKEIQTL